MRWWSDRGCIISYRDSAVRFCIAESVSLYPTNKNKNKTTKKRVMVRRGLHHLLKQYKGFMFCFNSSLVGWWSCSRKGYNFPTYLPTGSAGVLVGVPHSVALWRFFPPPLLERYLVYYILADIENKVRHLWWPNFLQPNPTLCLSPLQTSAPPRRALGHAMQGFQRHYYRKNGLI